MFILCTVHSHSEWMTGDISVSSHGVSEFDLYCVTHTLFSSGESEMW